MESNDDEIIEMELRCYKKENNHIESLNKIVEFFNGKLISWCINCDGCDKDITNDKIHNVKLEDNILDFCTDCFTKNYNIN